MFPQGGGHMMRVRWWGRDVSTGRWAHDASEVVGTRCFHREVVT